MGLEDFWKMGIGFLHASPELGEITTGFPHSPCAPLECSSTVWRSSGLRPEMEPESCDDGLVENIFSAF